MVRPSVGTGGALPRCGGAWVWGMIVAMWSHGGVVGAAGRAGVACRVGAGVAALWLLAGCGNSQSPTEVARLAEARRVEAEAVRTPDVVDALFLGSGPLIPRDGSQDCPLQGFWSGYPRGTTVRMRVSSRVPGPAQAGLSGAVGPLAGATGGALTVIVETTAELDPQIGRASCRERVYALV